MGKATCKEDSCDRLADALGWCNLHYQRWLYHGDPQYRRPTTLERWLAKVDVRGVAECWPWTASRDAHGYGQFSVGNGKRMLAHRFGYIVLVELIPDDLEVRHRCDNPACQNWVSHLVAGTHLQNMQDMTDRMRQAWGTRSFWGAKTHCPQGHPYSGENLYLAPNANNRQCRTCNRLSSRRYAERKRKG